MRSTQRLIGTFPPFTTVDLDGLELPEGLAISGALEIARALGRISGGEVLDVGTGRGDLIDSLFAFLGGFTSFTGVDVDPGKLEKAREKLEGRPVRLLEMDGGRMDFSDGSFDTVCISNSLHHLERVDVVLAEMYRVLRPGGTFIVQEMFSDGEQTPAQRTDIAIHHWGRSIDTLLGEFHAETYTREGITSAVGGLGLRDLTSYETTHAVKCLLCEDRFKCEDPLEPEFVENEVEGIERDLTRLEGVEDAGVRVGLAAEGRALIERLRETGATPASTLFVIGRR